MNIVEAYLKFKGSFVILISGLSGSGKNKIAKKLSDAFKINYVSSNDFYKRDYNEKIKLSTGDEVINWDSDEAIDWNALNSTIDKIRPMGIIVTGQVFPNEKMAVPIDYHINLKVSKQNILKARKEFIEKHPDKYPDETRILDTPAWTIKFNQLTYPYYLNALQRSKVNKFINANDLSNDEIYEQVFDAIVNYIESYLYKDRPQDKTTRADASIRKQQRDLDEVFELETINDNEQPSNKKNTNDNSESQDSNFEQDIEYDIDTLPSNEIISGNSNQDIQDFDTVF